MTSQNATSQSKSDPSCAPGRDACDAKGEAGPVREAGGTTGEGNLSPQQADRTGGATAGVGPDGSPGDEPSRSGKLTPDA